MLNNADAKQLNVLLKIYANNVNKNLIRQGIILSFCINICETKFCEEITLTIFKQTMAGLRLRQLEEYLQQLDVFENPKVSLEQYATSAHIASHLLYTAQSQFDDIKDKNVADLGSGCGILSLGAKMLDAEYVVGFEIDSDAVDIQYRNCSDIELFVEVVQCDVLQYLPGKFEKYFDTVIMNPPFGTKKNAGIDMKFLEAAIRLSSNAVYSLHKSSTRDYVLSKATQLGARGTVIAELRYDLPRAYRFHKKASIDIQVDFIRFELKR